MIKNTVMPVACICAIASGGVIAETQVDISGFLTAGVTKSDNAVPYLGGITDGSGIDDRVNFRTDSTLGLQVNAQVDDQVTLMGQLVARESDAEDFSYTADWAYAQYQFTDNLAGRVGRMRMPIFLVSDYIEVGYAYPWIRPPAEVYALSSFLATYNGTDAVFNTQLGSLELQLQPYAGNLREEIEVLPATTSVLRGDRLLGLNVLLTGDIGSLRLGYAQADMSVPDVFFFDIKTTFTSAGATLDWNNLVVYTEYAEIDIDSLFAPTSSSWYVTAGYRFGKYMPHITLSTIADAEKTAVKQESVTLGLRYDLAENTALKVEYQNVEAEPTGVFPAQSFGYFESNPGDDVNIISVAVDILF